MISYKNFEPRQSQTSSTSRELYAVMFGLRSFAHFFYNKSILWYTDNMAASKIAVKGSHIEHLQDMALTIDKIRQNFKIDFRIEWVSRDCIPLTDSLSKTLDADDWETTPALFYMLENKWGPHSIERFADSSNTKLPRFNSKFFCPNTETVDAFSVPWGDENNFLVPPVSLIPQVLNHLRSSNAEGTLIAPFWPSASFFPLLRDEETRFRDFVSGSLFSGIPGH